MSIHILQNRAMPQHRLDCVCLHYSAYVTLIESVGVVRSREKSVTSALADKGVAASSHIRPFENNLIRRL